MIFLGELQGSEFLSHSKRMQKIMSTAGCRSSSRMQIAAVEFLAHSKRMHNIMSTAGCRSSSRMQIAAVRGECRNRLFAESLAAQVQIGVDIEQEPRMPYPCQRRLHPQNRIFVTCFTTHRANEVLIMVGDFLWHACQPERKN